MPFWFRFFDALSRGDRRAAKRLIAWVLIVLSVTLLLLFIQHF